MIFRNILAVAGAAWLAATAALAQLPDADGQAILVVAGDIAQTNAGEEAHFDVDMLRNLDWVEIETYTSFTEGPQRFAGPTLASLLRAVEAQGSKMTATALNGYFVSIPIDHAQAHDVILAMEHNGERMRVRDKGPIWVVYPLSESAARAKPFDTEMIWQLQRLEVQP